MSDLSMEKFVRLVRKPPVPHKELVEEGAYPVKQSDGTWEIPVEHVRPILDSYFERSHLLTGDKVKDFADETGFYLTTEPFYPDVLASISKIGGAYIGVGTSLSFTFPAWQGAAHAFVVDYKANIPFGFTPLWGAMLSMAKTRAAFVSLLLGIPITADQERQFSKLKLLGPVNAVKNLEYDEAFAAGVEEKLKTIIIDGAKSDAASETALRVFNRFHVKENDPMSRYRRNGALSDLYYIDGEGRGGLLSNEEAYQKERAMFMNGRVTGVEADMADSEFHTVYGALMALGMPLGVIYLSNVESWFPKEFFKDEDVSMIMSFYNNLRQMTALGTPTVISSIDVRHPITSDLQGYLNRALPLGLEPHEAVRHWSPLLVLRHSVIKMKADSKFSGSTPSHLLDEIIVGAYGFLRGVLEDARRIFGDEPLDLHAFHERLMKESVAYKNLSQGVRDVIVLNLMDLGIIRPPYPVLYNSGSGSFGATGSGTTGGAVPPGGVSSPTTQGASRPIDKVMAADMANMQNMQNMGMSNEPILYGAPEMPAGVAR